MSTVSPHGENHLRTQTGDRGPDTRRSAPPETALPEPPETPEVTPDAAVEIDLTQDPPQVLSTVEASPAEPVFAGAAAFRPIVISLVLAVSMFVGYGVVALVSVLWGGAGPDTTPVRRAGVDRVIVASRGSSLEPGICSMVAGRLFVDSDGNAIADPWDPSHDFTGAAVHVVSGTGETIVADVTADGTWQAALASPTTASISVVGLADYAQTGLWPGPRLLGAAGERSLVGQTCSMDLGMIWKPLDVAGPLVRPAGSPEPLPLVPADALAPAAGWQASVQLHGRVWADADDDGDADTSEAGVAGVRITLRHDDGSLAATAVTGADGTYAVSNLGPGATYELSVSGGTPTVVRAMGAVVDTAGSSRLRIDTSLGGLSIWGVDFGFATSSSASGTPDVRASAEGAGSSAGDQFGNADRRDRDGS